MGIHLESAIMTHRHLPALVLAAVVLLAPGCRKSSEDRTPTRPVQASSEATRPRQVASEPSLSTRGREVQRTGQKLIFGHYPSETPTQLVHMFQPLMDYLSQATGYAVELRVAPSYATGLQWIAKGEVDLFRSGPNNYLQLNRIHGEGKFPVIAREIQGGKSSFRGAIVVRKDSSIQTLADLKGKRFAFGDRTSTLGSVVPRGMLKEAGVALEDLKASKHFSSHDDVAVAVRVGEFDAGAVKDGIAKKFLTQGLRVLAWSPEVPTKPIYARPDLPEQAFQALRKALVAMSQDIPEHAQIFAGIGEDITGFMEGSYEEYAPFRSMFEQEEREPERSKNGPPAVK